MYEELKKRYSAMRNSIVARLSEFGETWRTGNDEMLFEELIFCLMTPQSKAKICWNAVRRIAESGAAKTGEARELAPCMTGVRFRNTKAQYIALAKKFFSENRHLNVRAKLKPALAQGVEAARLWLVQNVKGMGYKEASHFLRNIGFGANLAILDRHIIKNMVKYGVIKDVPQGLGGKKYLELEKKFLDFAKKLNIPPAHLDMLFWSGETGEIFK